MSSTRAPRGCRLRTHVRRPQPGAASRGAVRRRPAADRGGGRDREDQHARLARRPPDGARRAARADPPAHVQPSRRPRDAVARRTRRAVTATRRTSGAARSTRSRTGCIRLHGRPLGLRPDFTVLDQADAADVMNLLREELGFATKERRFPRKDTLASIYSRTVNAGEKLSDVLKRHYPWCIDEADGIRQVFQAYTGRKREQNVLDYDDLLLFWKALATVAADARTARVHVRSRAGRRVPGHERAAGRHPRGHAPGGHAAQHHRGRRRRAIDLRVPRRDRAQHPGVPHAVRAAPP